MPKVKKTTTKKGTKTTKSKAAPKKKATPKKKGAELKPIGKVTHYYDQIRVVVIRFSAPVRKGDVILIEGGDNSFSQKIVSMEKDHEKIDRAQKGHVVGIKVKQKARDGYRVYKL